MSQRLIGSSWQPRLLAVLPRSDSAAAHRALNLRRGFSLIELLIVILIIGILTGGVIGVIVKARATASSVSCLSNLQQLYMAFQAYTSDHGARLPDPGADQISWEKALLGYYGDPKVLLCPSDHEIGPGVGSSYDWRDTGDATSTLAGQVLVGARTDAVLIFESLPGWHERRKMNTIRVNGSTQVMDEQDCLADLRKPAH